MKETPAVTPHKTMRGHTKRVRGIAHLPGGQHVVTCSFDGSLRPWQLENSAQIGDWRDGKDNMGVGSMALSPSGKTIASGSIDESVRLWDVETGKVTTKWKGHRRAVASVCWSPDGKRIVSGSYDGTARVWDFKSRKPVQSLNPIKTGHEEVFAVHYSPNAMKFATSGYKKTAIIIWDAKTGVLLSTIQLDREAWSLTWTTSDFLIFGTGDGSIEVWMFDTTTWWRIALLEGHKQLVKAITLSPNSRLLASASWDKTTRLWDLNTYLQVGPPLEHEDYVECAAFSADGKLLSTGCADENAYVWNIDAILKAVGLENFLTIPGATIEQNVICAPPNGSSSEEHISRLSHDMSNRSFLEADATGYPDPLGSADQLPSGFFDDAQVNVHVHSSTTPGALLDRFSSLVRRSRHNEVIITQVSSESSSHTLLGRLSLYLRSPPNTDEISEYPRPPMLSRLHLQEFLSHLSSLFPTLDSILTKQPNLSDPRRPRGHVQVHSSVAYPHSSTFLPTLVKQSNSSITKGKIPPLIAVLMSPMSPQCGIGR